MARRVMGGPDRVAPWGVIKEEGVLYKVGLSWLEAALKGTGKIWRYDNGSRDWFGKPGK